MFAFVSPKPWHAEILPHGSRMGTLQPKKAGEAALPRAGAAALEGTSRDLIKASAGLTFPDVGWGTFSQQPALHPSARIWVASRSVPSAGLGSPGLCPGEGEGDALSSLSMFTHSRHGMSCACS